MIRAKDLILITSEYDSGNRFMQELVTNTRKYSGRFEFYCAAKEFWNPSDRYQIVHIHWVEELFEDWEINNDGQLRELQNALKAWKMHAKIVHTFHNHQAHQKKPLVSKAIDIVLEYCDAVHHLGDFSKDYVDQREIIQNGYVIPHINYEYKERYSKAVARSYFGFEEDDQVILVFGAVRTQQEKERILRLQNHLEKSDAKWIIPRWQTAGNMMQRAIEKLQFKFNNSFLIDNKWVGEQEVAYYFEAADIVLIPRGEAMNSGNLVIAFNFSKIVVGPDFGNIGEILKKTGNPTYRINDDKSEVAAIDEALTMLGSDKGASNYEYSQKHWHRNKVGIMMSKMYDAILDEKT